MYVSSKQTNKQTKQKTNQPTNQTNSNSNNNKQTKGQSLNKQVLIIIYFFMTNHDTNSETLEIHGLTHTICEISAEGMRTKTCFYLSHIRILTSNVYFWSYEF